LFKNVQKGSTQYICQAAQGNKLPNLVSLISGRRRDSEANDVP